jgi:uncharacterized protein
MSSLADKLKSLGVKTGAQNLAPFSEAPEEQSASHDLETILHGHSLDNEQGETFVVDSHFPLDHRQGSVGLLTSSSLNMLAAWANNPGLADLDQGAFAFIDTETTGLSGGSGTYAFLIGAARFEAEEFHVAQYFMRNPLEEPAQLLELEKFLAPCQAIVTFNGKSFDAPLINTRFLTHGWRSPLLAMGHIDLLHLARRLWRDRLPSRTLINLEVQILGSERSEEDIPGWMIPQMYFDYLRSGDPTALKNVFYHNSMDVISLAALFNHLASLLDQPFTTSIEHGVDIIALARLFEDLGEIDRAIQLYLQGLEYEDHTESQIDQRFRLPREVMLDAIQRLAMIHKRQENYPAAVSLWQKAAQYQHLQAHVELAKFYEHYLRDYAEALSWTASALEVVNDHNFPRATRLQWTAELESRLQRLQRKIGSGGKV